jgi:glutamine amidotransferase
LIAVLDYGIGNLRSAEKALQHVGAQAALVRDPATANRADGVVLPGVGNFGKCMEALRASGLDRVAMDAVESDKPFLGICVGMQMMYEGSDESPSAEGLGILPGTIRLLPEGVKRPQMQWNVLDITRPGNPLLAGLGTDGSEVWAYFVHSYAAPNGNDVIATCDYGGPVVAAVGRDRVWATQFHPEKSGSAGLQLLANFAVACA